MTKKADVKQGEGSVEAEKKSGDMEQPLKSEKLKVPEEPGVYTQPTANVGFSIGHTMNLGNYESVRVAVDVHLPCYVSEIDDVFEYAKGWVEGKFEQVMDEIRQNIKDAE